MRGIDWIKIAICMFEDEKMRLFDAMEERDLIVYLWLRLLLQAGKVNDNGLIYLTENVPYTKEMLSVLFNRPKNLVEKVFNLLESFGMIEIYENNIIRICNWEKHQNIEGMKKVREINKERTRKCRARKKNGYQVNDDDEIDRESCYSMKIEDSTKDKDNAENKYNIKSKDDHENKNIVKNRSGNEDSSDSDITDEKVSINLNLSRCCNANVTEQKEKREQENKKKKLELDKEEKDLKSRVKEKTINTVRCMDSSNVSKESKVSLGKVSRSYEDLKDKGFKLIRELEEYEVNIKGLTLNWILERLSIHEEKYINMAINIAIQRNKYDINYITGILKNWLKEGYPKTYEEMEFESSKEKPKLRFNNFEARTYNYEDLEERLLGWRK
ncbi:phage replisome organizer N-terminal domain-containing protein [Clostridium beijerinckii]|uniref:DnaD domain protein n=1 Tax=Clostridium beijerinckii TaxID=1520 RepID=A0A1S8RJJ0_CLOBE|nr:phage replisome organizer N-terminal domain-containing protein [Clostridium beijerinckii]NRY63874.1 putative phage replisome organizer [Clostridium beijerinckii]OOM53364.1 hypothetical protein CLBCK_47950 [Clostridium beijerinckii]